MNNIFSFNFQINLNIMDGFSYASSSQAPPQSLSSANKRVDIVIIGGGPACLALMCNAVKTNR